ncbi:hypothetical protein [Crenothrix polyspora]|uniref:ATP-binding protein n=1 Tax=Crenothrix polyspora TaxID=360316 RepID=A0A1R4H8I8_9GAMM|nr:hypothetical protein [Crenothrix polyspora]SJM92553.1 conserved hypothetical protein [Crenothrix polyspora]
MKKPTFKQKIHYLRRLKRILKRHRKKSIGRYTKKSISNLPVLSAPHTLSISKNSSRNQLLKLINDIGRHVIVLEKDICISLKNIEQLKPSATLLFIAEIDRFIKLKKPDVKIKCEFPINRKVKQVFKKLGFFKMLGKQCNVATSHANNIQYWQFASGLQAEGEKTEAILDKYDGKITEALNSKLYVGLTEAMLNSHQHAHLMPRKDNLDNNITVKNWWMLSQEKDGVLYVAFCDLGVGIPETIPIKHPILWKRILLQKPSDSLIVKEATALKKTSTNKQGRGHGLNQMINSITNELNGRIKIYSNRGVYTSSGKNSMEDFKGSIHGTIIEWTIPIQRQEGKNYEQISNYHS